MLTFDIGDFVKDSQDYEFNLKPDKYRSKPEDKLFYFSQHYLGKNNAFLILNIEHLAPFRVLHVKNLIVKHAKVTALQLPERGIVEFIVDTRNCKRFKKIYCEV